MDPNAAKEYALNKMIEHGIRHDPPRPQDWKFRFDNSRVRFGFCSYRHQKITLSWELTTRNTPEKVHDTILHEIAHALTPPPATAHGHEWRRVARAIGCTAERCYGRDVKTPPAKYIGECPLCHQKFKRQRRPRKILWCIKCQPIHAYAHQYQIRWKENIDELINDLRQQIGL